MQEALPYKTWQPIPRPPFQSLSSSPKADQKVVNNLESAVDPVPKGDMKKIVTENAVIVFGRRGCCMSHVVKLLLHGLGVNPAVYEIDEDDESGVLTELGTMIGGTGTGTGENVRMQFPAVFIGGKLFGGLERIMGTHISGELVPILKQAGALWL